MSQIRLVRTDGTPFVGQPITEANQEAETGWVIIGTERDGTLQTDETTQIREENIVLVAGTDVMIQKLEQETERS